MKKILFALLIMSSVAFGQQKMSLTPTGYAPVVTDVEGKTAADLYKKTKDWVQTYYKNPKEVLKADIENEMIRVEGFCRDCYETKVLGMANGFGCFYSLEVSFKDGKYRFDYSITSQTSQGQRVLYTYRDFYKKSGEVRKAYEVSVKTMDASTNGLYDSLYNYISGKTDVAKKDW